MVNYRRNKIPSPDTNYFITIVTHARRLRFIDREDFIVLWREMQRV